jgi:hypothetical protein
MGRDVPIAGPLDLRHEIPPFRQPPSDLSLGELYQQRSDRHPQRLEILELDQPVAITGELRFETVEVRVSPCS